MPRQPSGRGGRGTDLPPVGVLRERVVRSWSMESGTGEHFEPLVDGRARISPGSRDGAVDHREIPAADEPGRCKGVRFPGGAGSWLPATRSAFAARHGRKPFGDMAELAFRASAQVLRS